MKFSSKEISGNLMKEIKCPIHLKKKKKKTEWLLSTEGK